MGTFSVDSGLSSGWTCLDAPGWGDTARLSMGEVLALCLELLSSEKKLKSDSMLVSCLKAGFDSSEVECHGGLYA